MVGEKILHMPVVGSSIRRMQNSVLRQALKDAEEGKEKSSSRVIQFMQWLRMMLQAEEKDV